MYLIHYEVVLFKKNSDKLYKISAIGKKYLNRENNFIEILKYQLLKYSFFNKTNATLLFPYRALFNTFFYIDKLSRLEFLYSLFSAQSTDTNMLEEMIKRINYLQDTYYNIETDR